MMHAELLRSRLEAAGFHPIILGEDNALTTAVGPVRLRVPLEEAEEAKALIADFDTREEDSAE